MHRVIECLTPGESKGLKNGCDRCYRISESGIIFIQINSNSKGMIGGKFTQLTAGGLSQSWVKCPDACLDEVELAPGFNYFERGQKLFVTTLVKAQLPASGTRNILELRYENRCHLSQVE